MTNRLSLLALTAVLITGFTGCAVGRYGGGCGGGGGLCGADIGCGVEACEEPSCGVGGCGDSCGGCSMAGQQWCGDGSCEGLKFNVCTGSDGCGGGCEPGCGAEPSCGVGGCGDSCGGSCGGGCCLSRLGSGLGFGLGCIGSELRSLCRPIFGCGGGCGGCDSELYWNEWHNDPPRCSDPCDNCGNWIGPTASAHRAPYDHEFAPRRISNAPVKRIVR